MRKREEAFSSPVEFETIDETNYFVERRYKQNTHYYSLQNAPSDVMSILYYITFIVFLCKKKQNLL